MEKIVEAINPILSETNDIVFLNALNLVYAKFLKEGLSHLGKDFITVANRYLDVVQMKLKGAEDK